MSIPEDALHETRPLIRSCLTRLDREKRQNTSFNGSIYSSLVLGMTSIISPKVWNNLDTRTKTLPLIVHLEPKPNFSWTWG